MKKYFFFTFTFLLFTCFSQAQLTIANKQVFTKADTLRGSNNENRDWWDVLRYDIMVKPDFEKKEIKGEVTITCKVVKTENQHFIQIDLQEPLIIDNITLNVKTKLKFEQKGNVCQINLEDNKFELNSTFKLHFIYHGKPREAKRAPWDGGWVWSKDKLGRPFVSVACQGLGASSWYPCKDYQGDEPDNGASLTIIVPDSLVAVGNGNLISKVKSQNPKTEQQTTLNTQPQTVYTWYVKNPINNYNIIPSIGNYINISDTFQGEKGILDLNYWVLDYNKEKAEEQFQQVKPMLKAFEYWFGPYPFYEDGYKLVEAPHLGMEHQSAIAYGNNYMNGYRGRDLSGSGWGLKWDFIIIHESGHEWFANSITTKDIADMWVHEGFTNYSEVLFTDFFYGKEAGNDYCYGLRKNIANDKPIIGVYGVNNEGSGDMYYKASNMIHGIRNALNDDEKFRQMLRKMNQVFYHQTVTTQQIEQFLIEETGLDLQKTFDQYLRTTQIPTLEYYFKGRRLFTHFTNCIDDFTMPITILPKAKTITPITKWKKNRLNKKNKTWFTTKNMERLYLLNIVNVPKP